MCQIYLMFVLFVGITRLETVESFPSPDSFSSTFAVANISPEKNLKSLGFVERLHRRSINDCQTTIINSTVTRSCATISSVSKAGYGWEVAEVTNYKSIELSDGFPKREWFVWRVPVNSRFVVFMFGLRSTDDPGKYHFVRKVRSKLILSDAQSQPENNLTTIDARCFEVLSSNEGSDVVCKLFLTHKDNNELVLKEDAGHAGEYRFDQHTEHFLLSMFC